MKIPISITAAYNETETKSCSLIAQDAHNDTETKSYSLIVACLYVFANYEITNNTHAIAILTSTLLSSILYLSNVSKGIVCPV
jgi:hypothetical protein